MCTGGPPSSRFGPALSSPRYVAELLVVASCELKPSFLGEIHQPLRLLRIHCKGFLDIDTCPLFQAELG